MALFKISKGSKSNLPETLTEGYCWYTYDDSKFYIDHKDGTGTLVRKAINAQDATTLAGNTLEEVLAVAENTDNLVQGELELIFDCGGAPI